MTSLSDPRPSTATPPARPIWRAGALAAVVAAVANTAVYLLGQLTPASWEVDQQGTLLQLPVVAPALASVVGIVAGIVALWLLSRFSWGLPVWTAAAVVVGLASVVTPLQAATDRWTGVLLALMHVVALVVALVVLRPAGRRAA